MKTCEKCSVDLIHDPGRGGWPREREGAAAHTPERCRDRLAARLAEVERAWSEQHDKFTSEHVSLAAQLATAVEALERIAAPQDGGLAAIDMRRSIAREALAAISATGGKETGK